MWQFAKPLRKTVQECDGFMARPVLDLGLTMNRLPTQDPGCWASGLSDRPSTAQSHGQPSDLDLRALCLIRVLRGLRYPGVLGNLQGNDGYTKYHAGNYRPISLLLKNPNLFKIHQNIGTYNDWTSTIYPGCTIYQQFRLTWYKGNFKRVV